MRYIVALALALFATIVFVAFGAIERAAVVYALLLAGIVAFSFLSILRLLRVHGLTIIGVLSGMAVAGVLIAAPMLNPNPDATNGMLIASAIGLVVACIIHLIPARIFDALMRADWKSRTGMMDDIDGDWPKPFKPKK
jgi:hypothetical protein